MDPSWRSALVAAFALIGSAGAQPGAAEPIGSAERSVMWPPERGAWLLALEDDAGHTLDSAHFVVR